MGEYQELFYTDYEEVENREESFYCAICGDEIELIDTDNYYEGKAICKNCFVNLDNEIELNFN